LMSPRPPCFGAGAAMALRRFGGRAVTAVASPAVAAAEPRRRRRVKPDPLAFPADGTCSFVFDMVARLID